METKEKNRQKKTPAAPRTKPAARKAAPRPKQPPVSDQGDYEVYTPDAESQQTRYGTPEDAAAASRRAPARRAPPPKKTPQKRTPSGREAQYRPYYQANQRNKARKKRTFRENVAKFFSYQNPLVQKFYKVDPAVFGEEASAARREKRAAEAEKKRKQAERLKTPAVIYTQPTSFNSRRLAVQLTTILAVVLALVLGMSVFFRVETISVVGADIYSEWTVR